MKKSTAYKTSDYALRGIFILSLLAPLLGVAFACDYLPYWGILAGIILLAFPLTLWYYFLTELLRLNDVRRKELED